MLTESEELELLELEEQEAIANGQIQPQHQTQQIPKGLQGDFSKAIIQPQQPQDPRYPNLPKTPTSGSNPLIMLGNTIPVAVDRMAGYKDSRINDPQVFSEYAKPISEPMGKVGKALGETQGTMSYYQQKPFQGLYDDGKPAPTLEDYQQGAGKAGETMGRFVGETIASIPDPSLIAGGIVGATAKAYKFARPAIKEGIAVTREAVGAIPKHFALRAVQKDLMASKNNFLYSNYDPKWIAKNGLYGKPMDMVEKINKVKAPLILENSELLKQAEPYVKIDGKDFLNKITQDASKEQPGIGLQNRRDNVLNAVKEELKQKMDENGYIKISDMTDIRQRASKQATFYKDPSKSAMQIDPDQNDLSLINSYIYKHARNSISNAIDQVPNTNGALKLKLRENNRILNKLLSAENVAIARIPVEQRQAAFSLADQAAAIGGALITGNPLGAVAGLALNQAQKSASFGQRLFNFGEGIAGKGTTEREMLMQTLKEKGIPEDEINDLRSYYRRSGRTGDFENVETDNLYADQDYGKTGTQWKTEQDITPNKSDKPKEIPSYPEKNNIADLIYSIREQRPYINKEGDYKWKSKVNSSLKTVLAKLEAIPRTKNYNVKNSDLLNELKDLEVEANSTTHPQSRENLLMVVDKIKKSLSTPAIEEAPKQILPASRGGESFNEMIANKPKPKRKPLQTGTVPEMIAQTGKIKWTDQVERQFGKSFEEINKDYPGTFSLEEGGDFRNAAERLNESFGKELGKNWDEADLMDEFYYNKNYGDKVEEDTRFSPEPPLKQETPKEQEWNNQFQMGLTKNKDYNPRGSKIITEDELSPNRKFDLPNGPLKKITAMETRWQMRDTFSPDRNKLEQVPLKDNQEPLNQQLKSTTKGTTTKIDRVVNTKKGSKTEKGAKIEIGKDADIETAVHEVEHAADMMDKLPDNDRKAFIRAMGLKDWNDEARERMAYGVAYLAREGELPNEFPRPLQTRMKRIAQDTYGMDGQSLKTNWEKEFKANPAENVKLAIKGQSSFWEGMPEAAKDAIKSALKRGVTEKRLKTLASAINKAQKPAVVARIVSQINREYKSRE